MEVAGSWADLPDHLPGDARRPPRRRGHDRGLGPPVAQLPVRRRACTSRSPARSTPTGATRTTGSCGTPGSAPCSPTAGRSATTTGSGSTAAGSWPRRSVPPIGCWWRRRPHSTPTASSTRASSGCRRPGRRPPDGDARRPGPRADCRAVSPAVNAPEAGPILVVDVGTSGVRAAVVRPDATVTAVHHRPVLPSSPAPGLVEFDPVTLAEAALDVARAAAGRRRAGGRGGGHEPAGVDHRLGPRHRRAGRPRPRVAGPADGRRLPRLAGRGAAVRPERVGDQGRPPARRGRSRSHP